MQQPPPRHSIRPRHTYLPTAKLFNSHRPPLRYLTMTTIMIVGRLIEAGGEDVVEVVTVVVGGHILLGIIKAITGKIINPNGLQCHHGIRHHGLYHPAHIPRLARLHLGLPAPMDTLPVLHRLLEYWARVHLRLTML